MIWIIPVIDLVDIVLLKYVLHLFELERKDININFLMESKSKINGVNFQNAELRILLLEYVSLKNIVLNYDYNRNGLFENDIILKQKLVILTKKILEYILKETR